MGYPSFGVGLPGVGGQDRERSGTRECMDEDNGPSPEQLARYRAMTPVERLRQAEGLYWTPRRLRAARVRATHPDWTEAQVEAQVRQVFARAGT